MHGPGRAARTLVRGVAGAAILLTVAAHSGAAQTIAGTVTDTTGAPLADVVVELRGARDRVEGITTSNSEGAFTVVLRRAGSYRLRLSRLGLTDVTAALESLRPGDRVDVQVVMSTGAVPLEPLIVRGSGSIHGVGGFYERSQRHDGRGLFVTRAEIDQRPTARASELVRHLAPVRVVAVRPEGSHYTTPHQNMIMLRTAAGTCAPTIYIDGVALRQEESVPIDASLTAQMLEGVEVYRGVEAPPPFVARSQCGVVAFWTRPEATGGFSWRRIATIGGIAASMLGVTLLLVR